MTDHILFGTPGTLLDWILRHHVIDPKKIKMFVLDEADVMIALQGHQDQSIRIHKSVNSCFRATGCRSIVWDQILMEVYFCLLSCFCVSREQIFAKLGLHLETNFHGCIMQVLSDISLSEFVHTTQGTLCCHVYFSRSLFLVS